MIRLIDTHAHIQGPEFESDRDEVVERARRAGVTSIIVPAVDLTSAVTALELSQRHAGIYATVGYHPHEAAKFCSSDMDEIEELVAKEGVVAIGEIGLDFYRMHSPREAQLEALDEMLRLADRSTLPVVVHCRDAHDELLPILEAWSLRVRQRFGERHLGVMHYFGGDIALARRYVDLGFLISVHTSVTHPKADNLRDVVIGMPLETLVLETDSPYGAPQPKRGKRNEPAYVVEAAAKVAELKGLTLEEVAKATTANAARLFALEVLSSENAGAPA